MSINKVAKLAGVSNSTVSRVINSHPRVAPETERAVRSAMEKLQYTPSDRRPGPKPHSKSVPSKFRVAFMMLGSSKRQATPAFEQLVQGVSRGAAEFGVQLSFMHVPDVEHLELKSIENETDGLILHGAVGGSELRERLRKLPTVWLMGNRRRPDWGDQVLPDAYRIGEIAARYLHSRGHKELAFLNLDAGYLPFQLVNHSFGVHAAEMSAVASTVAVSRESVGGYWPTFNPAMVDQLVERFLKLPKQPTGIFIADDIQTAIIQPALVRAGVKIGPGGSGGVDVISCNNERPYLIGLNPLPAAIDIRVESIGRLGVEQLVWRLSHPAGNDRVAIAIEPVLVTPEL